MTLEEITKRWEAEERAVADLVPQPTLNDEIVNAVKALKQGQAAIIVRHGVAAGLRALLLRQGFKLRDASKVLLSKPIGPNGSISYKFQGASHGHIKVTRKLTK